MGTLGNEKSSCPHTFNPRMKLNLTRDSTNTTISIMSAKKPTRTNKPKPKALPIPELDMEDKMEVEEELDDTVAPPVPARDVEEVKEISTELAGLSSLLGNINQTPVSSGQTPVQAV